MVKQKLTELITKMSQIKIDDFIRFNGKDNKGKFHYIGQVVEINETEVGYFTMETFQGTMSFKVCDENELEATNKPIGWDKFSKDPFKYRNGIKEKEIEKDTAPVIKTQKELIFDFVKANKKLTKVKLTKALKKEFPKVSEAILMNNMALALIKLT